MVKEKKKKLLTEKSIANIYFKSKREIKTCPNKQKSGENLFLSTCPISRSVGIPQSEVKGH